MSGSDARPAVLHGFVGDAELGQVVTNHLRLLHKTVNNLMTININIIQYRTLLLLGAITWTESLQGCLTTFTLAVSQLQPRVAQMHVHHTTIKHAKANIQQNTVARHKHTDKFIRDMVHRLYYFRLQLSQCRSQRALAVDVGCQ